MWAVTFLQWRETSHDNSNPLTLTIPLELALTPTDKGLIEWNLHHWIELNKWCILKLLNLNAIDKGRRMIKQPWDFAQTFVPSGSFDLHIPDNSVPLTLSGPYKPVYTLFRLDIVTLAGFVFFKMRGHVRHGFVLAQDSNRKALQKSAYSTLGPFKGEKTFILWAFIGQAGWTLIGKPNWKP